MKYLLRLNPQKKDKPKRNSHGKRDTPVYTYNSYQYNFYRFKKFIHRMGKQKEGAKSRELKNKKIIETA